ESTLEDSVEKVKNILKKSKVVNE
ncbi:MAG: hypothetical protein QG646_4167, partial [Euryarchaeota archaeon]|nr:hypothetical protein [Euryarchaeota archaeon]